jgi:hypothetical protein
MGEIRHAIAHRRLHHCPKQEECEVEEDIQRDEEEIVLNCQEIRPVHVSMLAGAVEDRSLGLAPTSSLLGIDRQRSSWPDRSVST